MGKEFTFHLIVLNVDVIGKGRQHRFQNGRHKVQKKRKRRLKSE